MTLSEAIKSGRPYRRRFGPKAARGEWISADYRGPFHQEAILDPDWEVQEPTVEVTRSRLDRAMREVIAECAYETTHFGSIRYTPDPVALLAEKLGFEGDSK